MTSGPTEEPIDAVRHITNRSSGAQGTAVARAALALGARVTFVTGPASVPPPEGAHVVRVRTAADMLDAVEAALPADAAVFVAAVADWRVTDARTDKLAKSGAPPALHLTETVDILARVSKPGPRRPTLVVGFAAETGSVAERAAAKRLRKGCDWIVANDVSADTEIMGGTHNRVTLITEAGSEDWPRMSKADVGERLAARIAEALAHG